MQKFAELVYTQIFFSDDQAMIQEIVDLAIKLHMNDSVIQMARGDIMRANGSKMSGHFFCCVSFSSSPEQSLEADLASTVGESLFSDFSIECDDGPPIFCHRVLLLRSAYFAALFSSSFAENSKGCVRLRDASRNGVRLLLRYLVCDDIIDDLCPDDLVDV